jgi:hypothetical protein
MDRSARRNFPIDGVYSFHNRGKYCCGGPLLCHSFIKASCAGRDGITPRGEGNNYRLSTPWREVISLASVAKSFSKKLVQFISAYGTAMAQRQLRLFIQQYKQRERETH